MSEKTLSEQLTEDFFDQHGLRWRRIRLARKDGFKRPDYAVAVEGGWCIVEVTELTPQADDKTLLDNLLKGTITASWVEPGGRLRRPIKKKERQLRKFSARGVPTIICVLDTTVSSHTLDFHIRAAMQGNETLRFSVSENTSTAHFIGTGRGRDAVLHRDRGTAVSAVAVLRQPSGSDMVADLHHNQFATVPINPAAAAPYVRHQFGVGIEKPPEGPTWFDIRDNPEYADFFADPQAAADRVIREILEGKKH